MRAYMPVSVCVLAWVHSYVHVYACMSVLVCVLVHVSVLVCIYLKTMEYLSQLLSIQSLSILIFKNNFKGLLVVNYMCACVCGGGGIYI